MGGVEIEARGVTVGYGPEQDRGLALNDVTVRARPGEIVAVLGPNGAGKSTLLKVLALLLRPERGEVYVNGVAAARLPRRELAHWRRRIGFVPDTPVVFNLLTGREMLHYVGELYGRPRQVVVERVAELLPRFRFTSEADLFVRTYSQGMRKKLSLMAALVVDPELLLADEPSNSLDPEAVVTMGELLAESRRRGAAIVLSTHLLALAEEVADRVVLMHRGRVMGEVQPRSGTPMPVADLESWFREAVEGR